MELAKMQVKAVVNHLAKKAERHRVAGNAVKAWELELLGSKLVDALDEVEAELCRREMKGVD